MHLVALLILPMLACAAPTAKQAERADVEVKLSSENDVAVNVIIQNNGKEPLELPYRVTPLEHLVVELRGAKGKQYKIERTVKNGEKATPGTLTVPPGQSKTFSVHICHVMPALGDLEQKVTCIARLKHGGKTIESKPLIINPEADMVGCGELTPGSVDGQK